MTILGYVVVVAVVVFLCDKLFQRLLTTDYNLVFSPILSVPYTSEQPFQLVVNIQKSQTYIMGSVGNVDWHSIVNLADETLKFKNYVIACVELLSFEFLSSELLSGELLSEYHFFGELLSFELH